MKRFRWHVLAVCSVGLVAVTGCQFMRDIGFESRGSQLAQRYHEEKVALAAKNAELTTRLASSMDQRQKMQQELEQAVAKTEAAQSAPATTLASQSADERWRELSRELADLGMPVVSTQGGKAVRLTSDVLFRSGKCTLKTTAEPMLSKVADAINHLDDDVLVFVDGHTDSTPLRYTKKIYHDNYGLGAARANAVARELVKKGVPSRKLVTRSFGADKPLADNNTKAGKEQNRRVEISFVFPQSAGPQH